MLNSEREREPHNLCDGQGLTSSCKIWWKVGKYAKERLSCGEPLILSVLLDCPWQKIKPNTLQINHAVYCHVADYFSRYIEPTKPLLR